MPLGSVLSAFVSEDPCAGAWKSKLTVLPDCRPVTVSVYSPPSVMLSRAMPVDYAVFTRTPETGVLESDVARVLPEVLSLSS